MNKNLKKLTQEELENINGGAALQVLLRYLLRFGANFILTRQLQKSIIDFFMQNDLPSIALGFSNFFTARCIINGMVMTGNVITYINEQLKELEQIGQGVSKDLDFSDLNFF